MCYHSRQFPHTVELDSLLRQQDHRNSLDKHIYEYQRQVEVYQHKLLYQGFMNRQRIVLRLDLSGPEYL